MKKLLFCFSLLALMLVSCTPTYMVVFTAGEGGSVSTVGGEYDEGAVVSVSANPAAEFEFVSWSDGSTQNPRNITVSGTISLTATFAKKQYDLNITIVGEGSVLEQVVVQGGRYNSGSQIKLTATATEGWEFVNWTGDIGSSDNPITINLNTAKNVTANFNELEVVSMEILNPIDTLVISRKHKFQVEGTYSNGGKVDLSDIVEIEALTDNITQLANNEFTVGISGNSSIQVKFKELTISSDFISNSFEYLEVGTDLVSVGDCELKIPIVIINYFPTSDGVIHDEETGPSGFYNLYFPTVDQTRRKVHSDLVLTKNLIEYGSRFRDYGTENVEPYVCLEVVKYINLYEVGPYKKLRPGFEVSDLNYKDIFEKHGIKELVNESGVKEIWITIFPKSPEYPVVLDGSISNDPSTYYNIAETNMSSPISGDISNSFRINDDLPVYDKTYVVYGYNAHRGPDTNIHNRGHQIEVQLMWLEQRNSFDQNNQLFWNNFVGIDPASNKPKGRSGMTHFPPNTDVDYDYCNMTVFESDIMNWTPGGGTKTEVNCDTWRSINYPFNYNSFGLFGPQSYENDAHSKWLLFWFQSIPGYQNNIPYVKDGIEYTLTNWWDLIYNWDEAIQQGKTLWE